MVLVHPRTDPEHNRACYGDEGRKRSEDHGDGRHEQYVGIVDRVFEFWGLSPLADLTGRPTEEVLLDSNNNQVDDLSEVENCQEASEGEIGEPVGRLVDVSGTDRPRKGAESLEDFLGRLLSNRFNDVLDADLIMNENQWGMRAN